MVENTRKASQYDCPVCQRPFCQRCSQIWHPNLTCDLASAQRAAQDPTLEMLMQSSSNGGTIRPCPRCKFLSNVMICYVHHKLRRKSKLRVLNYSVKEI